MATFEIIEQQGLKIVKATVTNETIRAEAGALHYLQGKVELKTAMPSAAGLLKSMVTQESIFRPTYTGSGVVYFGPPSFHEYMMLDLDKAAWVLDRGAYVCSDAGIEVGVFRNKALAGLFGGEGWFQTKLEGTGRAVLKAPGPVQTIDLQNDRLVVDGSFAVARQAHLDYTVQRASKSLIGSAASGEGAVSVIEGTGRVYLAPVPNWQVSLIDAISGRVVIPSKS